MLTVLKVQCSEGAHGALLHWGLSQVAGSNQMGPQSFEGPQGWVSEMGLSRGWEFSVGHAADQSSYSVCEISVQLDFLNGRWLSPEHASQGKPGAGCLTFYELAMK